MTSVITREERLALLAAAPADELIDAADACLAAASSFAVVTPPVVGCVPAQVREPVLRRSGPPNRENGMGGVPHPFG